MVSIASAIRWAEECQNVLLPPVSSQVSNFSFASSCMGRMASHTCPLISAASTFLARPSEMDLATSIALLPFGYCRMEPSGKVIFICPLIKSGKINKSLSMSGDLKQYESFNFTTDEASGTKSPDCLPFPHLLFAPGIEGPGPYGYLEGHFSN